MTSPILSPSKSMSPIKPLSPVKSNSCKPANSPLHILDINSPLKSSPKPQSPIRSPNRSPTRSPNRSPTRDLDASNKENWDPTAAPLGPLGAASGARVSKKHAAPARVSHQRQRKPLGALDPLSHPGFVQKDGYKVQLSEPWNPSAISVSVSSTARYPPYISPPKKAKLVSGICSPKFSSTPFKVFEDVSS